jgi:hypothetical protein
MYSKVHIFVQLHTREIERYGHMERELNAFINSLAFVKRRRNIRCIFKAANGKYQVLILPE